MHVSYIVFEGIFASENKITRIISEDRFCLLTNSLERELKTCGICLHRNKKKRFGFNTTN